MNSTPTGILKKHFGFDTFRPMQEEIIQSILNNKDCLVIMPTGGGKSMCFQIPAIILDGTFIIISPLIALMKDQVESLRANGIEAEFINSTLTYREENEQLARLKNGQIKLLYLSPEKLQTRAMYHLLREIKISGFAIDEAHCISVWGHDFREEYSKLHFLKDKWPDVPIVALTATADKITRRDIVKHLKFDPPKIFMSSLDRPNLSLKVLPGQKVYGQVKNIVERHKEEAGIIYCLSRKSCEEVSMKLNLDGFKSAFYHAGMEAKKRSQVQEDFIKDNIPIIVATIAFGMGIDKSNIRFVIHYNLPKNIEGYYQEIGRGGRDGLPCETVLFYSFRDVMMLRDFAEKSTQKDIQLAKLKRIQQYAEAEVCRRKILMAYFGEDLKDDCGNCDICKNPPEAEDATTNIQMALSGLKRLNENVGISTLIDVLRGSQRSYIFQNEFDQIKTFGVGKEISYTDWQHYILQMLHHGFIEIAYDQNHVLKITDAGNEVLFHNRKVNLIKPHDKEEGYRPYEKPAPQKTKKQEFEEGLFESLRTLRKQIADSKGVPPYVVFSDVALKEMAAEHPINPQEMSMISGVGEFKLAEYGDVFITEIQKYLADSDIINSSIRGKTYQQTFRLIQEGKSIIEIAKAREIHENTVYSHLAYLVEKKLITDIARYITDIEIGLVKNAVEVIGFENSLKPLYDQLEEKVPYGKIRLVLSYLKIEEN